MEKKEFELPKKSAEKREKQIARFRKLQKEKEAKLVTTKEVSSQEKASFRNKKNRGQSFTERSGL